MTDDTFSEIDVPDAHVAGYEIGPDGVQFWRDPGNGQFARPGWSTAKGLAMRAIDSLGDAARLHAKEGNGKPVVLRSKGDALVDIGVPEGAPVKVRYVDDQFGLIDVKGARSTQPVKIRWDRLDAPGDAVSDAVDPTFPKVDGDPAGPLRRVKHVTGADALDPDPVGLDLRDRDFSDEDLSGVDLSTHDMSGVDLAGYEVTHSKLWSTKLDGANLRGTSFNDSILQSADLVKANAEGAKFTEADLAYTSFAYASVAGADFTGARLMKTDFTHADLTGAKFGDADLTTADLSGANLHGVDLSKAKLDAAKMGGATFDAKTKFPDGFDTSGLTNAASPASPPKNYVPPVVDTGVKEGATFARQTDSGLRVGPGTDPDVRVPWAQHVPDGTVAVGFPSGGSDASAHGRAEQAIRAAGYDPKLVDRKALGEDKMDPSISYVEITAKKDAGLLSAFADIHEAMPQTRAKKETVAVAGGDLHLQRTSKAWMLYSEKSGLVTPDIPAGRVDAVAEAIGELPGGATMDEVAATARTVADGADAPTAPDVPDTPKVDAPTPAPVAEPQSMFDTGTFATGRRATQPSAAHDFNVWERRLREMSQPEDAPVDKNLTSRLSGENKGRVFQVTGYDTEAGKVTHDVSKATGTTDPAKAKKFAQDLANQHQKPMRVSAGSGESEVIFPNTDKPTNPVADLLGLPTPDAKPVADKPFKTATPKATTANVRKALESAGMAPSKYGYAKTPDEVFVSQQERNAFQQDDYVTVFPHPDSIGQVADALEAVGFDVDRSRIENKSYEGNAHPMLTIRQKGSTPKAPTAPAPDAAPEAGDTRIVEKSDLFDLPAGTTFSPVGEDLVYQAMGQGVYRSVDADGNVAWRTSVGLPEGWSAEVGTPLPDGAFDGQPTVSFDLRRKTYYVRPFGGGGGGGVGYDVGSAAEAVKRANQLSDDKAAGRTRVAYRGRDYVIDADGKVLTSDDKRVAEGTASTIRSVAGWAAPATSDAPDAPGLSPEILSEIETGTHPETVLARDNLSASDRSALEKMVGPSTPGQKRQRADAIEALQTNPDPTPSADGVGPVTYRKKDYDVRADGTVMLDGKRVGEAMASKVRDAAGFKTTERVLTDELKADLADVSANYPQVLSDQDMKNNPHLVDVAMAAIAHLGPEKTRRGFMKDMAAKYSPPNLDTVRGRMSPAQAKATLNALRPEIDELTDGVDAPGDSKFAGDTTPAGLKITEAVIDNSAGFHGANGIKDVTHKFTTDNGPVSFQLINSASGQSADPPERVMVRGYTPTGETDKYLRNIASLTMKGLDGRPSLAIKNGDGSSEVLTYPDGPAYVSNPDDVRRWAIDQLNARGFLDGTDGTKGSRPDSTPVDTAGPADAPSLPSGFAEGRATVRVLDTPERRITIQMSTGYGQMDYTKPKFGYVVEDPRQPRGSEYISDYRYSSPLAAAKAVNDGLDGLDIPDDWRTWKSPKVPSRREQAFAKYGRPDGEAPQTMQSLPPDFNEADGPWADGEMTVKWDNRTWRIKPDGSVWMNHNDKRVPADSVIVTQVKNQALADGRTADVDIPPAEAKKVDAGVAEEMTEAIESDLNAPIESPPEPENLPKGKFPPTPQQTAMLEAFKTGQSMVVQAGAGAGKTSSLVMLAEYAKTQGRNGVFTAFNKAIVSDAGAKLPDNVNAATMHAIANRAMRSARPELMKRLNSKALTRDAQAKLLGITDGVQTDEKKLRPGWLAGWVLKGIDKFAMSADKEPDWTHLEPIRGLSDDENEAIAKAHLPALRAAWADLTSDDGKLRFEHATYLKLFELSNPKLGTDFVLFDECFPAGTPILTSEGYVPVDEIVDGSRRDWMVATQLSGNGVGWANVRTGYRTERRSDLVRVVHEHGTVFCTADHPFVVADGRVAAQSLAVGETLLLVQGTSDWAGEVRRGRRAKVLLQRARDAGPNDQPGGTSRVGGEGTSAGSVQSRQHVARRGGAHATQQPDAERVFAREDASDADRHGPPAVGSGWQRFGHDGTADDSARSVGDGLGRRACRVVWRGIASEGHADALQDRRSAPGAADSGGSGRGVALLDRPARIRRAEGFVLVESRVVSVTVLEPGDPDWVGVSGRANHVYTLEVDSESHTYFANGVAVGNCQDSSPVMASIIGQQRQHGTQLVYVGDADQSINGFMGAVDALSELEKVPGVLSTRLTHSFRFGPQVAEVANNVLANFSGARITGAGKPSTIGPVPNPAAILTRTNGTAMKFAIDALDEDKSVAMSPNLVKALTGFAKAAKSLREDGWTDHADLAPFASWDAVQHYVEDDPAGGDIKTLVELIDSHGPDAILSVLKNVAPPGEADVTILTAHTSKGLEFPTVRLADDFPVDQDKMNADDYRLMYVALTRAQQRLDVGANSWILRPPERPVPPFVDDAPAPAVVIPDEIPLIEDPRAPIVTKPVSTVTPVSPLTSTGGEYEAFTKRFPNGVKDSDVEADPALRDFAHKALHDVGSTLSDPPEFVTGMRAKFPKSSDKTMSVKQARATLNWLRHDIAADPARFDGFEVSAPEPIDTPVDTGPEIPDVPAPSGRGAKWSPAQIRAALRRINKSMTSLDIVNGKPVIATTSKPVDGGRAEVTRQPGIVDGDGNFVAAGPTETLTMKPKFGGPAGLEKWYGDQWSGEGVERYPLNQTPKRAALPDDGDVMDEQAPGGAFLLDDRRPGTTIDTNAHTAALVDDHNYQPFNPRKHGGAAVLLIDNEPAAVWVEGVAPTVAEVAEVVEYQGWRVVTSEGDGYDNLFSLDPAPPAERCRVAAMAHAPAQWLVAKDNYLSRIGVQAGCAVMVRHDSDQHGIIDVDQDGTLTPYPVRWDRFSNDPPGATTTLITTPRYVGNTTKAKAGAGAATEERVRVAGVGHAIIADNYLARHAPELVAGTVVPVSWVDASTAILESPGGQTIRASWSRFADEDPSAFTMDEMSVIGGNEFAALPVGTRFGVEALGAPLSTNEGRVAALVKTGDTGYTIAGDPAVEHEWDANVGAHLRLLVEKTKD